MRSLPRHPSRSIALRVARAAHLAREWYHGVRDARRVRSVFPWVAQDPAALAARRRDLEADYREYVTSVSTPLMAISLELAAFLDGMCVALEPRRVLDLGSGFSSFVLRRYARDAGRAVEVQSVDHDADWLSITRRYLERHGLGTSGLSTWSELRATPQATFDLIVHDLGGPDLDHIAYRLSVLPDVLELVAPGGVLVIDDANLRSLGPATRRLLEARGWRHWSLKRFVQDGFGRWALLSTPGPDFESQVG